ncbi:oxidoreductase [Streptomyces sp. NPDC002599]|uniref:oxidoreductase n=1 Tax=Streptomyces sp. NPDC002599 TaxID=3154421 RepID=UPI00331E9E92
MPTTRPVALVTGASSGIGEAAALALVEAGFEVVGTSRKTSKVTPRDGVTFLDLDVTSDASVTALVQQVIDRFGRIDVLVNNAGIGSTGAAEESSLTQDQHVFDINVFGVLHMTKAVLPHMRAQSHGRIINTSSIYGFIPQPYMAAHVASKHAVEGYSESLDHEVREHGVRILLVEPGATNTAFEGNIVQPDTPLPVYAEQRRIADQLVAEAVKGGDAPAKIPVKLGCATMRR